MFQICVIDQKFQRKKIGVTSFKFFLIAMIRNIKMHFFYIIEISKSMVPNKCIPSVSYDFSKFNGSRKIKV
jgi:hypothetical protein